MKSIKRNEQPIEDSNLMNVLNQALWYSRCCIISVSLMSGFGIPWNYDSSRIGNWLRDINIMEDDMVLPENVSILRGIYKKGEPHYTNTYNGDEKDFRNYLWDDSSFKRIITPTSQAYLIMDEIMLAEYLHKCIEAFPDIQSENKKAMALLLIKSADMQSQFMSENLRNIDGLFVPKADLSSNPFGDPVLEESVDDPEVSDQALALQAFSMASIAFDDPAFPLFADKKASAYCLRNAAELYEVFLESPEDIFEGKTRDLCSVIPSCIEYYNATKYSSVLDYVTMLALELESRIDMSGNLLRFPYDSKLTSNASCFNAINALIKSYNLTGIQKFQSAASMLYKKLSLLWSPLDCLYCLDADGKYKYTARDVGSVLSGLNAMRLFGENEYRNDAEKKLVSFFNSSINLSKLMQSVLPPPSQNDIEAAYALKRLNTNQMEYSYFCHPEIPLSIETNTAPVFAKKFSMKPQKRKYDINSSSFYSEYSLYASYEMMQMNYPEIQCFYRKDTFQT